MQLHAIGSPARGPACSAAIRLHLAVIIHLFAASNVLQFSCRVVTASVANRSMSYGLASQTFRLQSFGRQTFRLFFGPPERRHGGHIQYQPHDWNRILREMTAERIISVHAQRLAISLKLGAIRDYIAPCANCSQPSTSIWSQQSIERRARPLLRTFFGYGSSSSRPRSGLV
jgi:hypothetical protein